MSGTCPCGSGASFDTCCSQYLTGELSAPTAEALMRSRYSAFVAQNWSYLDRTQAHQNSHPPTPDIVWLNLEIMGTQAGKEGDNEGTVEFIARYSHEGMPGALHEISRFHKLNGEWIYVEGLFPPPKPKQKAGRNDPCLCGSGRKFKKCCGTS